MKGYLVDGKMSEEAFESQVKDLGQCPSIEVYLWAPADLEAIKEVLLCTSKRS